jgi:hypothetical protein
MEQVKPVVESTNAAPKLPDMLSVVESDDGFPEVLNVCVELVGREKLINGLGGGTSGAPCATYLSNHVSVADHGMIVVVALLFDAAGKHAAEVKPANPRKQKPSLLTKKPWLSESKQHYIYLDGALPTLADGSGGNSSESAKGSGHGQGHSKRGHYRRATWRRLSHPRFRNHPNFGGRIRVRSTWVGPTSSEVEGKIYTLRQDLGAQSAASASS